VGLAVICALLAALSSAGADLRPVGPPGNGIHGVVLVGGCAGPYRPGASYPHGCQERPYSAEVRVLRQSDRSEVARFRSRKRDGRFKLALRPGRYLLDPLEHGFEVHKGVIHVRVRKHTWVRVEIHYDNGQA
jgi:hypothetical protein